MSNTEEFHRDLKGRTFTSIDGRGDDMGKIDKSSLELLLQIRHTHLHDTHVDRNMSRF